MLLLKSFDFCALKFHQRMLNLFCHLAYSFHLLHLGSLRPFRYKNIPYLSTRLGFAIAINIEPDLLLVDEVLSVGDANFQKKCSAKIDEFKERGVSFMFVSHSIPQVRKICEKTIWIENSKVMAYGDTKEVCDKYNAYCANLQRADQPK